MFRSASAGIVYFAVVFGVGFVLGTVRVLVIQPRIGQLIAVLVELPVMLTVSWFACRWVVRQFAVRDSRPDRLVMGAVAFALVMIAELGVSVFVFGRTPTAHLESFRAADTVLGLLMQMLFALFPIIQTYWSGLPAQAQSPESPE